MQHSKRWMSLAMQSVSLVCACPESIKLFMGQVRPVHSGTATLKDATSEAIRDWVTNVETTHYILGRYASWYSKCICKMNSICL